jgi:hypothetical protein
MNSPSTSNDSSHDPSTGSEAQAPPAADPGSENVDTSASSRGEQNPLWLIAGAMALFFAVAAAFLVAG